MKKILFLMILSLALIPALVACGGAETGAPAAAEIDLSSLAPSIDVDTAYALHDNPNVYMLDVREPDEYAAGHIPGITLIPTGEVASRLNEIPTDKEVIVTCRTGNRSAQVVDLLREMGYTNVHNMEGGIVAWEEAGFPVEQ